MTGSDKAQIFRLVLIAIALDRLCMVTAHLLLVWVRQRSATMAENEARAINGEAVHRAARILGGEP